MNILCLKMHGTLPVMFVHPTLPSPAAASVCVWFAILAVRRLSYRRSVPPCRMTVGWLSTYSRNLHKPMFPCLIYPRKSFALENC